MCHCATHVQMNSRYVGRFVEGRFRGNGVYSYPNGSYFKGDNTLALPHLLVDGVTSRRNCFEKTTACRSIPQRPKERGKGECSWTPTGRGMARCGRRARGSAALLSLRARRITRPPPPRLAPAPATKAPTREVSVRGTPSLTSPPPPRSNQ